MRPLAYRKLAAWRQGMALAEACYEATKGLEAGGPRSAVNRMRRYSIGVPGKIAGATAGMRSTGRLFMRAAFRRLDRLDASVKDARLEGVISNAVAEDLALRIDELRGLMHTLAQRFARRTGASGG